MCLSIVLHADDFGLNRAVSDGILRGFSHGLLTGTSLLTNAPHAEGAIAAWRALTERRADRALPSNALRTGLEDVGRPFDLGVHFNLTQGRPLTAGKYPSELVDGEGRFVGIFRLFARLREHAETFRGAIRDELAAQIAFLFDHGMTPTHLNGHQYVEMLPLVADLLPELLRRFRIPVLRVAVEWRLWRTALWPGLRIRAWLLAMVKQHYARRLRASSAAQSAAWPERYFGTAHAGHIDARAMDLFLNSAGHEGVVEIGMHPGFEDDSIRPHEICQGWSDPLADSRPGELALVTSPALAERLRAHGARLGRLAELARPDLQTIATKGAA
jgi:predicted glycoside hydrolase/deacetylase ChbG (UPF0249 family)